MTVGQPRLSLAHHELTIAAETRGLWLGDLDCAGAPDQLPDEIADLLPDADIDSLNELLANRDQSQFYGWHLRAASLTWGIQQQREADRRCLGVAELARIDPPEAWPLMQQAKSYIALFHAEHLGRGLGRVAYERMCAFGLALGLDSIVASVNADNDRSIRLHKSCGFIGLGAYTLAGQLRLDMRLYNPAVQDVARDWMQDTISQLSNPGSWYAAPSEQDLEEAQEATRAMYARHKDLPRIILHHQALLDRFMAE